jgi:hypothetical protein
MCERLGVSTVEAHPSLAAPSGRPGWWQILLRLFGAAVLTLYLIALPVVAAVNWLGLPKGDESGRLDMELSGSSAGMIAAKLGLGLIIAAGVSCWLTMSRLFERVAWPLIALPVLAGAVPMMFAPSWAWFLVTLVALRYIAFTREGSPRELPSAYPPGGVVAALVVAVALVPLAARALTHSVTTHYAWVNTYNHRVGVSLENHGAAHAEVRFPDGRIARLRAHSGSGEFLASAAGLPCGKRLTEISLRYTELGHTGTIRARLEQPKTLPC